MTCQNLGVLCLQWSIVMASIIVTVSADTKPRLVPPEIIKGPNIHEFFPDVNEQKSLPCLATGTPPITYKWLFNGAEVHSGGPILFRDGNLHFMNPTREMEGYYQCLASNEAGVAISNMTFLQARVFEYVSIQERRVVRNQSVKELDDVVLPCNHITRSLPPARIIWEESTSGGSNSLPVQYSDRVIMAQDGSLVFSYVKKNDSATYLCHASNGKLGYFGSKVNLTIETEGASALDRKINEQPVLLYNTPDVTLLVGQELRLECLFGGWPLPRVEWTAPSGVTNVSHAWVIPSMTTSDAGVYSCRARKMDDRYLWSPQVNISVQVDAIPTFVTPMSNQEVPDSGRDVTFECQGWGIPSPYVTWYINGTSVENALDHSISGYGPTSFLVLRNIRTSATVACNASNAHGYRLQSAIVTVGESNAEHIPTSSSQHIIITSQMTSADKQPSTKTTTRPHQNYKSDTTQYHSSTTKYPTKNKDDEQNKDKTNTNNSPEPHVEDTSLSPTTRTIIIAVPVALAVILFAIIVVVIIFVRQRRRRGGFSLAERQQLRFDLRVPNERTYDSDDSGFDDLKAESERRALQGHLPPS